MANSDMKQAKSNVNIENKNKTFWKMNFLFLNIIYLCGSTVVEV